MLHVNKPDRVIVIQDPAGNGYIIEAHFMNKDKPLHCIASNLDDACDCVKGAFLDGTIGSGPQRRQVIMEARGKPVMDHAETSRTGETP